MPKKRTTPKRDLRADADRVLDDPDSWKLAKEAKVGLYTLCVLSVKTDRPRGIFNNMSAAKYQAAQLFLQMIGEEPLQALFIHKGTRLYPECFADPPTLRPVDFLNYLEDNKINVPSRLREAVEKGMKSRAPHKRELKANPEEVSRYYEDQAKKVFSKVALDNTLNHFGVSRAWFYIHVKSSPKILSK